MINDLESLFHSMGIILPQNIKKNIMFSLRTRYGISKHFSFIIDLKTNKIICYDSNIYFKTNTFPFTIHAEVQSITRYYKSRSISKNKKALVVVKLSPSGCIGNSKCCLNCMRFIRNNLVNLNLKRIYYSTLEGGLCELSESDLVDENFEYTKSIKSRVNQN